MRLLLDTNAILAVLRDAAPLSTETEDRLNFSGNEKLVSIASFWEMTIKVSLGKLHMARHPGTVLEEFEQRNIAVVLPVRTKHLRILSTLPHHHRDPFDRLLVAQALSEDCAVVSSDEMFAVYGVTRLW